MEVFPTGLDRIDTDLHDGGLPAGSIVGVEYPPASAGESFLWTVVARGFHPDAAGPVASEGTTVVIPDRIVYLATAASPDRIRAALATHAPDTSSEDPGLPIQVERLDPTEESPDLPASVRNCRADRPAIVVDAVSDFLTSSGDGGGHEVLAAIRALARKRNGIALFVFARGDRQWLPIERRELRRADGHVRFEPRAGSGAAAVRFTHLRGAAGPVSGFPAVFDLDVGRRVAVDTVERG